MNRKFTAVLVLIVWVVLVACFLLGTDVYHALTQSKHAAIVTSGRLEYKIYAESDTYVCRGHIEIQLDGEWFPLAVPCTPRFVSGKK